MRWVCVSPFVLYFVKKYIYKTMEENLYNGTCCCCLVRGYGYKKLINHDIWNENFIVYADILKYTFDINIKNQALDKLICTACISKLSEAFKFKTMILNSQDKNGSGPDNGTQTYELKIEEMKEIKVEHIKEDFDDEDFNIDGEIEQDVKTEKPTNTRSELLKEVFKKDESISEKEKSFLKRFEHLPFVPLPTQSILPIAPPLNFGDESDEEEKRPQNSGLVSDKIAIKRNIATILKYSNVTPFKSKSFHGYPCFYCRKPFKDVVLLREHVSVVHKNVTLKNTLWRNGAECLVVYVDVTDLKCTICHESMQNLTELKQHLIKIHKKVYYLDSSDRIIPFKIKESVYECQNCGFNFETFGAVERHMNTHYRNYVCNECGGGFVTTYRLKTHIRNMHTEGANPCSECQKNFSTSQKLKSHINSVHMMTKRFKCSQCSERFTEYFKRQKHLVEVHGAHPLEYKCNVCEKAFQRRYTLSRHMKKDHLEERDFQCEVCPYRCFTKTELRIHMIKHVGARIYQCKVCKKAYARKKTLKEHMRIHNDDRRFTCTACGLAFIQKCSLKGHIKTHHPELTEIP